MASEPMFSERHRQPRGIGKEFVKGVKGAATGGGHSGDGEGLDPDGGSPGRGPF